MRGSAFLLVLMSAGAIAASGGKGSVGYGNASASTGGSIAAGSASHGGGGAAAGRSNPRNVPPLAKDRKINEQDCSKPVDWTAGNLKCK